jgi:serine/threonine-protein kinase
MASPTGAAGSSSSKSDKDPAAALKKIGKYEIQKKIGAGGMGTVYLALDPFLKRNCALKVLPQEKAKNPTLIKRFRSEAQQAANLRHENIVSVYEAGEADGFSYIALEYVEGTDVANLVQKRGVIPLKRSIEMVKQVVQALGHAHIQGVVHRDIKPGNLLVRRDGVVKLADLGLARSLDDVDTSITRAGTTVGTVDYMAPEQARDSKASDVRSDLYSLGCTWYFMLTGEPPFPNGSLSQKLRAHAETPIPDPRSNNPAVTEGVLSVIRRMTEKKPTDRYQSPQQLLDDLESGNLTGDNVSDAILQDTLEETGRSTSKRRSVDDDDSRDPDDSSSGRKNSKRSSRAADVTDEVADDPAEIDDPWARRKKKRKSAKPDSADSDEAVAYEDDDDGRKKGKPVKRAADDEDGAPAFKPPPGRDPKDKEKLLEPDKPVKNNAAIFYALVGLVIFGLVSAVIWAVGEYNNSSKVADRMANPFANRDAVANAAGAGANTGGAVGPGSVGGNATVVPGANAEGGMQPTVTNVGGPSAIGGQGAVGPNAPGYDPGRLTTQIGGASAGGQSDSQIGGNAATGTGSTSGDSPSGSSATGGTPTEGSVTGNPSPGGTTSSGSNVGGSNSGSSNPVAGAAGGGASSGTNSSSNGSRTKTIGGGASVPATASGNTGSASTGSTGSATNGQGGGARGGAAQSQARIVKELQAIPLWAKQPRPGESLPVIIVQLGSSGSSQFATLDKALENVPAGGACIKLAGSGPFPLHPVKIVDKTRVVIEPRDAGNSADQPVVMLLPSEEGSASNFIETVNTTLDLRKLHLALDATDFDTAADDSMLSAVSSDLFLQNCSFSVKGSPSASMTAVKIAGKVGRSDPKAGSQPRVLFDETLIRGNNLTTLTVNGEYLDLVSRGSLWWSGKAPAVRFGTAARSEAESSRTIRLVSTTLCAQNTAFQMGGDSSQPVPTAFELINTLVAAPPGSDAPALFALEGWTAGQQKTALGKFLTWKSTGSLYTGWMTLLQMNPGSIAIANGFSQWHAAWKEKDSADKEQFQAARWPARAISDIAGAGLEAFIPQTVGKQYVKTDDGGWPGCAPERLVTVNLDALAAAQVATVRPAIPPGMFGMPPSDVLHVDVTKQDLGKVLEGKKLQTGMTILVAGSGIRQSSPIVIENVWVRMQFEQTDGPPLVITPRAAESKHDGFITIRNGGMEINRGVFTIPATERASLPKWFIHVIDGDLGLFHCRLQGPLNGTGRNKGLIRWQSQTGRAPARPFEGRYDGYNVIQSSFLIGSGTLIDADIRRRAMILHNSVLVSRDDLCMLNIDGPDSEIDAAVDVRYSTLSAADRFWQVRGGELGVPASAPLTIYADRSVFGPPLRAGAQRANPALLTYSGSVLDRKQLAWWENRCGYAPEITSFLRADSDEVRAKSQDFDETWLKFWGRDQVLEPLRGVNGVVLKKDLPTKSDERNKLDPDDFQLLPACRAATWEGGKLPIGAYIGTMQVPPLRAAPTPPAEKKKATPKAAPSGQNSGPSF